MLRAVPPCGSRLAAPGHAVRGAGRVARFQRRHERDRQARWLGLGLGLALAVLLSGGPARAQDQENDPIEPVNRAVFEFNRVLDGLLLEPVARHLPRRTPQFVRDGGRQFPRQSAHAGRARQRSPAGRVRSRREDARPVHAQHDPGLGRADRRRRHGSACRRATTRTSARPSRSTGSARGLIWCCRCSGPSNPRDAFGRWSISRSIRCSSSRRPDVRLAASATEAWASASEHRDLRRARAQQPRPVRRDPHPGAPAAGERDPQRRAGADRGHLRRGPLRARRDPARPADARPGAGG